MTMAVLAFSRAAGGVGVVGRLWARKAGCGAFLGGGTGGKRYYFMGVCEGGLGRGLGGRWMGDGR